MQIDPDTLKTVTPFIMPGVSLIIETYLKPRLTELFQIAQKKGKLSKDLEKIGIEGFEAKFGEYLSRSYREHSYIKSLAFSGQPKNLLDLYIPLTLARPTPDEDAFNGTGGNKALVNDYSDDFLPTYRRVLLKDTAGMGKSTLLKFLFLKCIEKSAGIPVFIELRQLSAGTDVYELIGTKLDAIDESFDRNLLKALIRRGDFVFFFDGYDEIPANERDAVQPLVYDFISKAHNNLFLISSRPDATLGSFADFHEFFIAPLTIPEAHLLIRKYDSSTNKERAEELINHIDGDIQKSIASFLGNPLLVSYLYVAYQYKQEIPLSKPTFYQQVIDALINTHDLSKSPPLRRKKATNLSQSDFLKVLRALGFVTLRFGKVEYTKSEFVTVIEEAKARCTEVIFDTNDLISDITTSVPLFVQEGKGIYYRWGHKSLQEYCAAEYISRDTSQKREILLSLSQKNFGGRYSNVLDIYYDVDYKSFRNVIVLNVLNDFANHFGRGISQPINGISGKALRERLILTFCHDFVLVPIKVASRPPKPDEITKRCHSEGLWNEQVKAETALAVTSQSILAGIAPGSNSYILSLLRRKHDRYAEILKDKECLEISRKAMATTVGTLPAIREYIAINNDPASLLNDPKYFNSVNSFLATALVSAASFREFLSPERCNQAIKEINDAMALETDLDSL